VTTEETDERHAVSDDRNGADSPVDDAESDAVDVESTAEELGSSSARSQTAVATRPQRPTGKRTRREVTGTAAAGDTPATKTDSDDTKSGDVKKPKTDKKQSGPSRNPFLFVLNYLKQVVAELRKVIWPNRKQMISYTTVVLVFLAFMVALIGGVDLGLAKLVTLVFG